MVWKEVWHRTRMSQSNTNKNLLLLTNTYALWWCTYIHDTCHNTYYNIGLKVQINTYCVSIPVNICIYITDIYHNTFQYTCLGWCSLCPAPKFNALHNIPNACQNMPIQTLIHTKYIPILEWCSTQVYEMIPVNTSRYISAYYYMQYRSYTQCKPIHTNTYQCMWYISYILMHTSTYTYIQIQTNADENLPYIQYVLIHTNDTITYEYRPLNTIHSNTYH